MLFKSYIFVLFSPVLRISVLYAESISAQPGGNAVPAGNVPVVLWVLQLQLFADYDEQHCVQFPDVSGNAGNETLVSSKEWKM